ncbi:morphogenic membrane protein MmpA [Streptomyces ziwulingensis]
MTRLRALHPSAPPARTVGRSATAGLVLATAAGLAWFCAMVWTLADWSL